MIVYSLECRYTISGVAPVQIRPPCHIAKQSQGPKGIARPARCQRRGSCYLCEGVGKLAHPPTIAPPPMEHQQARSLANPYPPEWHIIRRRILERDGHACRRCSRGEALTVSHINRIEPDCRPSNLWTLCRPCHLAYDRQDNARRRRYGRRAHLVQIPIIFELS